jgi:ribosome-associated translation inhibitor RaiA
MELPVQITYRGLDPSEALSDLIHKEADKLGTFFDRIIACRVLVEREQRHLRSGAPFTVRIDLTVPGAELTIDTAKSLRTLAPDDETAARRKSADIDAAHKDPALAVRDAFRRARRRTQDFARGKMGPHVRSSVR